MTSKAVFSNRGRADVDRALHSLEGILRGLALEGRIADKGLEFFRNWLHAHEYLLDLEPLHSISHALHEIMEHGIVNEDHQRDLLWLIKIWTSPNQYYDEVTADMQRLHGLMAGVAADDRLTDNEILGMERWIEDHHDLRGHWPYDDLVRHLHDVIDEGSYHPEKRAEALQFLKDFGSEPADQPVNHDRHKEKRYSWLRSQNPIMTTLTGVCAKDPIIEFSAKNFCFTGKAQSGARAELETEVMLRGGAIIGVSKKLHYLVIGALSSPCWAFAAYGRKVEEVMHLREDGHEILIVHENDFVKAVEGSKTGL